MVIYRSTRMITAGLVTITLLLAFCNAELPPNYTFVHEATTAPKISFYDYIVIGGGTAGIPLATTLSRNYSVLLLERGGSPYGNPNITNVANYGSYFSDTSPNSPVQQFIAESIVNLRPRILGGGTSVNGGFYSHGEARFNNEARLTDERLIRDSYKWIENVMVFEPVVSESQNALRAALVEAGVAPDNGFTYDHVIGTKVGGTIFDQNGTRHTAADLLQYANPKGLSVLLHATVHQILFKKTKAESKPMAHGVVFEDSLGNKHRAYLKGGNKDEIILSAGALGSPQLLILSGIGPKEQLNELNIKVVLQQPLVGKNMADNPLNGIFIPAPVTVRPSAVQVVGITPFGSYIESTGGTNFFGASPSVYQGYSYEMSSVVYEKISGPVSKGELKIVSRNPSDTANVTFNYFKEPEDLRKCVNGISTIIKAIESEAYSTFKLQNLTIQDLLDLNMKLPLNLLVRSNTSSSLEQYCRETRASIWHYHGGCRIGEVVDNEYKVFGVDALRVVDGSTLLNSPGTNPQASVLMLGRYMGVSILRQRLAVEKSNKD